MLGGTSSRTRLLVGAALLATLVALSGCHISAGPKAGCGFCGEELRDPDSGRALNATVTDAAVHVHLRGDGSARWIIRASVNGSDVERLRRNETLVSALAEDGTNPVTTAAPDSKRNVETSFQNGTLRVTFTAASVAERGAGGVLLVDYFHGRTGSHFDVGTSYEVLADRFVLHAPPGWTVVNDPASGTVRNDTVVWNEWVSGQTYVVVGRERSIATTAAGQVAVAADVADWSGGSIAGWSLGGMVLPGAALGVLLFRTGGFDLPSRPRLAPLSHTQIAERLLSASLVPVGLILAVGATAVAGRSTAGFLGFGITVPLALFTATGYLAERRAVVWWSTATLAPATAVPVSMVLVWSGGGAQLLVPVWSLLVVVVGAPGFVAGRRFAGPSPMDT